MAARLYLLLTLVVGVVQCSLESERSPDSSERIIGGQPARQGQFKYPVALHYNGRFMCTASIIGPRTVLTAAHCQRSRGRTFAPESMYGIVGDIDRRRGRRIDFVQNIPHPQYNERNLQNDIGILKTAMDIPDEKAQAVCIPRPSTLLNHYRNATAMGWGSMVPYVPVLPNELQHVNLTLKDHNWCALRYPGMVSQKQMCADGYGRGVCNGDSGGPLSYIGNNGSDIEVGVASFVRAFPGCMDVTIVTSPPVFTRVAAYTEWILSTAGDDGQKICVS